MPVQYWTTGLVVVLGVSCLAASISWIVRDRDARWTRFYRRYDRSVDQRWACPIAIGVDTLLAALLASGGAARADWIGIAVLVVLQTLVIAPTLAIVYRSNGRQPLH